MKKINRIDILGDAGKKTPYTREDIINARAVILENKERGYKDRLEMIDRVIPNMFDGAVYYMSSSFNVGEMIECHLKSRIMGYLKVAVAKAGQPDLKINGVEYEIKMALNTNSLPSPINHTSDLHPTILVTTRGCYLLDKSTIEKMLLQYGFTKGSTDYTKVSEAGKMRLKPDAYKLGKKLTDVNPLLSY